MLDSYKTYKATSFTLIEIVMSILILSILSVYSIPRLMNFHTFKASIFFKQIYNSILYAQEKAIGSGCHVEINVTPYSLTLKLRSNCRTGEFSADIQDPFYRKSYYMQNTPNDTTLSNNNFPIYFDHNGQARLTSTDVISTASVTINGPDLQETIYINGDNGSVE